MIFLFNLQSEKFYDFSPNWFDWFSLLASLIVTAISICAAYCVAESVYNREKKDRDKVIESDTAAELSLFDNSLTMLKKDSLAQVKSLKRCIEKKEDIVDFYPSIQIDFLQFTNIRNLYDKNRLKNKGNVKTINELMVSLYALHDFRDSLRSEFRAYYEKYAYHESKFYSYRDLLYNKYFMLCNMRTVNIQVTPNEKMSQFHPDDFFMENYSKLRAETFTNESIIYNGLRSREKLVVQFVRPLMEMSIQYIPEDFNAIEINEIANEVDSAFNDMESITTKHERAIVSHIDSLENAVEKIDNYMKTKKRRGCFG